MSLYEKIISKKEKIALVGLGYVGMPIAVEFSKHVNVIGFDINKAKIEAYKNGIDPTREIGDEAIGACNVDWTADEARLKEAKFIIVAVPTPVKDDTTPDLSPVMGSSEIVGRNLTKGAIVVYESTVYPGATEEICIPIIESYSGLIINKDFFVGYSPERINVGDEIHQLVNTPKIVSGSNKYSCDIIKNVYESILSANVINASSIKIAEAAKMYENVQRDVLIALANEFSEFCRIENIDVSEVTECASTKWNFSNVKPGLVGGHCIAVDPYYLINRAIQKNIQLSLIKNAREINEQKVFLVSKRIESILLNKGYNLSSVKVLLLGITYKNDVADCRNTKIPQIINLLKNNGINVYCYDPLASVDYIRSNYKIELIPDSELTIENYDLVIKMVSHQIFENQEFLNNTDYKLSDLL